MASHSERIARAARRYGAVVPAPRCAVYLIRHGRTGLNAAGVLRGRLDPPLDAVGEAEATALGRLLRGVPLVAVVTSPLRRARDTAGAIAAGSDVPVVVEPGVIDRDFGPWAGTPRGPLERRFGSLDGAPAVEPVGAFDDRVVAAVSAVVDRWAPGPVAVVAHDAVNRHVLARLVPALGGPERIGQRTGCWNLLVVWVDRWLAPIINARPGDGQVPDTSMAAGRPGGEER